MRLKVTLKCEPDTILPYNYNHHLYKAITRAVHNPNTVGHKRDLGFFTFSQLYFEQYSISANGIRNLGKCVQWYISSIKGYFLEAILKGFSEAGFIALGNVNMPIVSVEILATPEISEVMEFSCMSPITVTCNLDSNQGRMRYGRIEDHDFTEKLRQDLINKHYRVYDSLPSDDNLVFEFNERYMSNKRRVTRLINFNGIKILGYMIPFKVTGNPELIRVGFHMGFGNRNNCGFGMVKVWYPPTAQDAIEDEVG
ncbi:MAG: CRISPR-associated endoribonuclease Cas6 [Eubacteriales bacterium]|jgi:CRISPR-associated endoribonuclease Cas6|nr:CRISPR-associated endoribonuclease Cas6 [Eubacteriales bacterium]